MSMFPLGFRAVALGLLALSSCGGRAAVPEGWESIAEAPLIPGRGFTELQIGTTTLGEVFQRFGVGKVSSVAGDEVILECRYGGGQVVLLFELPLDVGRNFGTREMRSLALTPEDLVLSRRDLATLPLTTLEVRLRGGASFYRGACLGRRLGDPVDDLLEQEALAAHRYAALPSVGEAAWFDGDGVGVKLARDDEDEPSRVVAMRVWARAVTSSDESPAAGK